ncbi:MAG TPA: low molecular weight phosphatase family protein [Candidatus Paceibacterota bacterium]|jgi:protein-tyrosine-phosphatase|nr:low molecular weight phosphatase family protein [Candidatus Paceibacterota bacterium]
MILFVCRGNMFRSPIAKAFYNAYAKDGSQAESAGIWVDREHHAGIKLCDMGGLHNSIAYMKDRGIDISQEVGTELTQDMADRADKIFVMAEEEIWPEYLKNNPRVVVWDVPNPDVVEPEDAKQVGEQLEALVKTI